MKTEASATDNAINPTVELNGHAQTELVVDVNIKDKAETEQHLETLRHRILDMAKLHDKAFTEEERKFIINRLKLLEYNYKVLRNKYDAKYEFSNLQENARNALPNDQYDVDDPEVRKEIGYSLSYSNGRQGYTAKEIEELKRLIPDIDQPVKYSRRSRRSI